MMINAIHCNNFNKLQQKFQYAVTVVLNHKETGKIGTEDSKNSLGKIIEQNCLFLLLFVK